MPRQETGSRVATANGPRPVVHGDIHESEGVTRCWGEASDQQRSPFIAPKLLHWTGLNLTGDGGGEGNPRVLKVREGR